MKKDVIHATFIIKTLTIRRLMGISADTVIRTFAK